MTIEAYDAWILHKRPSGNSSVWLSFFTREKGILNCLYKGGRAAKKQGGFQPFTPLWLAMDVRNGKYFFRQAEAQKDSLLFKGNALFAGLYLNELIFYALSPLDPHASLFDAYQSTLQGLTTLTDPLAMEILLRRFEWALLSACGYSLSFTHEAYSALPIEEERFYQFVANEGFIVANTGISGRTILALAQGDLGELQSLKTAKYLMRQAINHLLDGRELKSRSLYPKTNK